MKMKAIIIATLICLCSLAKPELNFLNDEKEMNHQKPIENIESQENEDLIELDSKVNFAKKSETKSGKKEEAKDDFNQDNKKSFKSSIITGFLLIFISEIGDNTFIIALIFSLKFGMLNALIISSITLILLNAFWLFVGASLNLIMYDNLIKWGATCLFFVFATIMLIDGLKMDNKLIIDEVIEKEEEIENKMLQESKENIQENVESKEKLLEKVEKVENHENQNTQGSDVLHVKKAKLTWSIIWSYSMSLVVAECGDKSQITAITISATYNFKGVLIGSSIAFFLAILIAVSIGQFFSKHVSEKMVVLIGAALFYLYAIDLLIDNLMGTSAF